MIETFIFIHDQEILLDFIKYNKFKDLENLKYVFLGDKEVNKIEILENVIICRNLPINIEEHPKLTSFTGWYALWKNNLINSDFFNLFEYDINISNTFNDVLKLNLTSDTKIIGYIPLNIDDINYLKIEKWVKELRLSIINHYNIDIYDLLKTYPLNTICTMTSNHTFSKNGFNDYMNWIEPMLNDIKNTETAGHQIERSISLYYLINKINTIRLITNNLFHFQFDSHKTQGIPEQKFKDNYNKLLI